MLSGIPLKDRADRAVDLGVHQHHVFAVTEGFENDVGTELNRAGDVDDDVDLVRVADEEWILGDSRTPGTDRLVQCRLGTRP